MQHYLKKVEAAQLPQLKEDSALEYASLQLKAMSHTVTSRLAYACIDGGTCLFAARSRFSKR